MFLFCKAIIVSHMGILVSHLSPAAMAPYWTTKEHMQNAKHIYMCFG